MSTIIKVEAGVVSVRELSAFVGEEILVGDKIGVVMTLEPELTRVALFDSTEGLSVGQAVTGTNEPIRIPTGELAGRVLDPLGRPLDHRAVSTAKSTALRPPKTWGLSTSSVPIVTGIMRIDTLAKLNSSHHLGICGPQGEGRSALATRIIASQQGRGVSCIYVLNRQQPASLYATLTKLRAMGDTTVLCADPRIPAQAAFAPLAGVVLAHEWRAAGQQVLLVFDDLSTGAGAYQELMTMLNAYSGSLYSWLGPLWGGFGERSKEQGGGAVAGVSFWGAEGIRLPRPAAVGAWVDSFLSMEVDGSISAKKSTRNFGFHKLRCLRWGQAQACAEIEALLRLEAKADPERSAALEPGQRLCALFEVASRQSLTLEAQALLLFAVLRGHSKRWKLSELSAFVSLVQRALAHHPTPVYEAIHAWSPYGDPTPGAWLDQWLSGLPNPTS